MTKLFYLVNICDIFFYLILNMLKGANLKGGQRPSAPYWPAASDEEISPLLCKALCVSRKVLYKCNKLLWIIIISYAE